MVGATAIALASALIPMGYRLVWSDEFRNPGQVDPSKWTYETGFVRNEEAQLYRPENVRVDRRGLVIGARREGVPNPGYDPANSDWSHSRIVAEYTSGSIRSTSSWLYGRF